MSAKEAITFKQSPADHPAIHNAPVLRFYTCINNAPLSLPTPNIGAYLDPGGPYHQHGITAMAHQSDTSSLQPFLPADILPERKNKFKAVLGSIYIKPHRSIFSSVPLEVFNAMLRSFTVGIILCPLV